MGTQPEQKEQSDDVMKYVTAVVYAVMSIWAVYTTFIVAGALAGTVVDGQLRLAIAVALALIFPIMTAMGFSNTSKEGARGIETLNRVLLGTIVLSMGTAVIIGVTMAGKVIPNMQNDPNWFLSARSSGNGFPKLNQRYHRVASDGFCTLAHTAKTYYCPD